MKNCMKCGTRYNADKTGEHWCNTCCYLLSKKHSPVSESEKRALGLIPNREQQEREPIPCVLRVERWPEIYAKALPQKPKYNRLLSQIFN